MKISKKARQAIKETVKEALTAGNITEEIIETRTESAVREARKKGYYSPAFNFYYQVIGDKVKALNNKQIEAVKSREAAAYLKKLLKPGETIHTICRHVSRSGMMRHISLIYKGRDITYYAALVLGDKRADDGGIKEGGCGLDMGFNLVYNLGYTLYPNGTPKQHGKRNGNLDFDGGYAFNQSWL